MPVSRLTLMISNVCIFEGIIYTPTGPPSIQQRLILNLTDLHERIFDLLGSEPKNVIHHQAR